MRILVVNDGFSDVGGVQSYLDAVLPALESRGHTLAVGYCTDSGSSSVSATARRYQTMRFEGGTAGGIAEAAAWHPDVCFSHNMRDLDVDRLLTGVAPVVKFMHGYFGTCVSSLKTHAFPTPAACDRTFGPACLPLYLPRRCGSVNPLAIWGQWQWASKQRTLLTDYAAVIVASGHMRREFARHLDDAKVHVNPLFATLRADAGVSPVPQEPGVVFLGRMTSLKGGDLLIRAVHDAATRLRRPIALTMLGDGPRRADWERLAAALAVPATFPGWITGDARADFIRTASCAAVPSIWPEPFGLAGLDAAAVGVPSVAVATGGIGEWLCDGVNGILVAPPASSESFGAALARLLADPDRQRTLRAGARQVAGEMTLERHVHTLAHVLEQVRSSSCVFS